MPLANRDSFDELPHGSNAWRSINEHLREIRLKTDALVNQHNEIQTHLKQQDKEIAEVKKSVTGGDEIDKGLSYRVSVLWEKRNEHKLLMRASIVAAMGALITAVAALIHFHP